VSSVIKVGNLGKHYNLGNIGSHTMRDDIGKLWAKLSGKQYETHKIGDNTFSNSFWALKDINFEVKQGEVLGIIGKNGAGKSTLLKILSKVTAPTCGEIKIKGRIASLLEVGTGFHPELTGRENIFMNGAILGMTKREIAAKFDEIVDFSGIEQFIDTPVKRYSSGMYVRLAFAVAAHLEPEILIVDEVLAVGDAEFQKKCLGKMKDVSGQGRTVLFVSHDMGSIVELCSKVIYLKNGNIELEGLSKHVISYYLSSLKKATDEQLIHSYNSEQMDNTIRFKDIILLDENQNRPSHFLSGQDIEVLVSFSNPYNIKTNQFHVSISITDELKNPIFHLSTSEGNGNELNTNNLDGSFKVKCLIKKLPLPPAKYYIHLFCSDLNKTFHQLDFAYELSVIAGNFFGNGKSLDKKWGLVYLKSNWELIK
jgi:lipopolysaccharide transport system ATP-binding protein